MYCSIGEVINGVNLMKYRQPVLWQSQSITIVAKKGENSGARRRRSLGGAAAATRRIGEKRKRARITARRRHLESGGMAAQPGVAYAGQRRCTAGGNCMATGNSSRKPIWRSQRLAWPAKQAKAAIYQHNAAWRKSAVLWQLQQPMTQTAAAAHGSMKNDEAARRIAAAACGGGGDETRRLASEGCGGWRRIDKPLIDISVKIPAYLLFRQRGSSSGCNRND